MKCVLQGKWEIRICRMKSNGRWLRWLLFRYYITENDREMRKCAISFLKGMFNRPIKSAVDRFDESRNLMQIYYKFESHNCYMYFTGNVVVFSHRRRSSWRSVNKWRVNNIQVGQTSLLYEVFYLWTRTHHFTAIAKSIGGCYLIQLIEGALWTGCGC